MVWKNDYLSRNVELKKTETYWYNIFNYKMQTM